MTCEDHREIGFGVGIELAQGVEFLEDLESEEVGLIDDEKRLELLSDQF